MKRISQKEIDSHNRIPIIEVATKLGININHSRYALCFLHNEKTPSLSFSPKLNIWKCFGCGEHGGVISLVMSYLGCSFIDAIEWLNGGKRYLEFKNLPQKTELNNKHEWLKPNNEIYTHFHSLCTDNHILIKRFFHEKKKIAIEVIEQSKIKLLGTSKDLEKKLKQEWGVLSLVDCGLFTERVNRNTGEIFYSLFWYNPNTAIIPFFNEFNHITFLKGRDLDKNRGHLNLKNVPTDIYNRRIIKDLKPGDDLLICEGETDTLSALSMKFNAVGLLGAQSFKDEYVNLLKDYNLRIVPDNDDAGMQLMKTINDKFSDIGKSVDIVYLIDSKDLNEYYVKQINK